MKNTKTIIIGILSILLFSGCSLVSNTADGGVFRSDDGGKTFSQKVKIDDKTSIGSANVLSLAVNPQNGNEAYVGTKTSGMFKTTDAGETWQSVKISQSASTPQKIYSIAIDPKNPSLVYVAAIVDGRGLILKSSDGGANWGETYPEPSDGSFVLALAVDPSDSGKIFGGTTRGQIIFSENGGETWRAAHEGTSAITKIAFDQFDSNLAYFAVNENGLLRTKDGGKTFDNLGEKNVLNLSRQLGSPMSIITDPNREDWAYAGTSTGLFRSKNGGDDWELVKVLNSPQENAIRGIAVNPKNSEEIVYGASQVFYKSVDGGESWATTQSGGSRVIEAVGYNRQDPSVIYIGMNSR
ncbi:MAG: YCF48-related protein [Candidatus Moranbacteria bacterium]|nr:YCF48-related protein [Candidatus Moranbacteria bacterium]